MAEIKISAEAINDLQGIKKYITEDLCNEEAAKNTLEKIMNRLRILEMYPEAGSPLASKVLFETNYRYLVCGNYTAFYRHENGTVYIDRILYGRRDYIRILFDLD